MKNPLLILIFFVSASAFSQDFSAELILGINASQVDGDYYSGFNKPGPVAGMAVKYPLGERIFIQPEILYIQKGSRSKNSDPDFFKWRINYVEIPVVFNYALAEKFRVHAGVAADVLIGSSQDTGGGFIQNDQFVKRISWVSALGFEYVFTEKLALNARHMYSLAPFSIYGRWWNNTIAISLRVGI